jgi:hypothetical protein
MILQVFQVGFSYLGEFLDAQCFQYPFETIVMIIIGLSWYRIEDDKDRT